MTTAAQLDALVNDLTLDADDDEEQLSGFLIGAEEAIQEHQPASIVGVEVQVVRLSAGPDARTGLTGFVRRDGTTHEVALADLTFAVGSELGLVVAAYRRWQGRKPLLGPSA